MKKKELIITEDNYKGYLELYILKMTPFEISEQYSYVNERECCRVINFISLEALILLLKDSHQLLDFIEHPEKQNEFFKNFINESGPDLKERILSQRRELINIYLHFKMLKIKYPYLDLDIEKSELEEALKSSELLKTKKIYEKTFYKIDYKSFEEYLETSKKLEKIPLVEDYHYQAISRYNYSKVKK